MKNIVTLLLISAFVLTISCATEPTTGDEVIQKMHQKWEGKMPQYMFVDQQSIFYKNGFVEEEQVWFEAISAPSKLHIRINEFESGNGMLFLNDTVYYYQNHMLRAVDAKIHYLLALSFNVYHQDPKTTIDQLSRDKFDMSKMYSRTWKGKDVYVVGASDSLDNQSNQFIIDKEKLVVLQTIRKREGRLFTIDFQNYQEVEGYYMATEKLFTENGEKTLLERYDNIRFPENIDEKIFNPEKFSETKW